MSWYFPWWIAYHRLSCWVLFYILLGHWLQYPCFWLLRFLSKGLIRIEICSQKHFDRCNFIPNWVIRSLVIQIKFKWGSKIMDIAYLWTVFHWICHILHFTIKYDKSYHEILHKWSPSRNFALFSNFCPLEIIVLASTLSDIILAARVENGPLYKGYTFMSVISIFVIFMLAKFMPENSPFNFGILSLERCSSLFQPCQANRSKLRILFCCAQAT